MSIFEHKNYLLLFVRRSKMDCKTSVSALQEYCAKKKLPPPTYEYVDEEDGSFTCQIAVMGTVAQGRGRSKRNAEHLAAATVIKCLRLADMPQLVEDSDGFIPTTDVITQLRDYCVQHQMPMPTIEIVQQAGTPDAPEFTALCSVATIRRYGVSETKKDARQKAAYKILRLIVDDVSRLEHQMQVVTLENAQEDIEEERYEKFKTYREMTESTTGEMPGVLLCDRHNYFKKFNPELKDSAFKILSSSAYECAKDQALDVLEALKIRPKVTQMPSDTAAPLLFIELDCEYNVVFAGLPSKVYGDIVEYFKVML